MKSATSNSARCIYLKLEHPALELIQQLRLKWDPLAEKIPPHVTVVFPFSGVVSTSELITLLESTVASVPITFSLGEPILDGDFFYFPLQEGRTEVISMHDRLYASLPAELLSPGHPFRPHLTFARMTGDVDPVRLLEAARKTLPVEKGRILSVVLEKIGAQDESLVEFEHSLPKPTLRPD